MAPGHPQPRSHPHPHGDPHPHGHNRANDDLEHLLSHIAAGENGAETQALTAAFVEGFRQAADKTSFLRLAGIPFEFESGTGTSLKLVDVAIATRWQVGTASPAFASSELAYLPFPGAMVRERTQVTLVYVSLTERRDVDLSEFMRGREGAGGSHRAEHRGQPA